MPMELKEEVSVKSEDEEDELEKLRLVALQSLKKPAPVNNFNPSVQGGNNAINNNNNNKRRNFLRSRNGQFRTKNTNLISIPTIDDNPSNNHQRNQDVKSNAFTKLILPQDRYSNVKKEDEKTESSSKFDRYDNSDKSESETDYRTDSETENESPGKLERADSLEALMQELENEIQGNSQTKSDEVKKKIKKRKKRQDPEVADLKVILEPPKSEEVKVDVEKEVEIKKEIETKPNLVPPVVEDAKFPQKRSPLQRNRRPFQKFDQKIRKPRQPYNNHNQYTPTPLNYQVPPPYHPPHLYNPLQFPPTPIIPPQILPNLPIPQQQNVPPDLHHRMFYERPLSPLKLNTDDALTIARAPLSPRSAAFVLQNRDAIERRKKSPRRSYSRSPSPRYHRSKSKSRSRTPLKDERRITPVKEIRKRSPLRRRSVERRSPENLKKKLVKERLGNKKKRSRSLSPVVTNKVLKVEEKLEEKLDPVLEARKRKFETNGIKNKEGIIRLRPKQDDDTKTEDEKVPETTPPETILTKEESPEPLDNIEDDLEEPFDDILNPKVDDIFSDEETDSENEGRFKNSINNEKNQKSNIRVVPFSKLLDSKPKSLSLERTRNERTRGKSPPLRNRDVKGDNHKVKGDHKDRLTARKVKAERKEKLVPTIESKKIEIKIRNPSKYETTSKYDVKNEKERPSRKVEVAKKEENSDLNVKADLEDDENGFNNQKCDSGDLRAQLSRKRAERQNRLPTVENVPSRLLQNALQGAVFKKQKKIKSENETAPKDGKMPIHLRLGIASGGGEGPQEAVKPKKVQGKSKGRADQV